MAANFTLTAAGAVDLGPSTVGGALSVTAAGAGITSITQSGALSVGTTTSLTPGAGNSVLLDNAGNDFTGAVGATNGLNLTLRDLNALVLGAVNITGALSVTTGGALTQSGALSVGTTTSLTAGAANNITLDNAANNFTGAVTVVSGNDVSLRDANALILAASTVSGALTLVANGAITQSGALSVGTTTSLTAGAANNITLDNAANAFTGAVSVVSGLQRQPAGHQRPGFGRLHGQRRAHRGRRRGGITASPRAGRCRWAPPPA